MDLNLKKSGLTVARNIRDLRRFNKMTVAEFASVTGIHESTIRRIEARLKGHASTHRPYNPSLATLVKISKAVDCQLEELVESKL